MERVNLKGLCCWGLSLAIALSEEHIEGSVKWDLKEVGVYTATTDFDSTAKAT